MYARHALKRLAALGGERDSHHAPVELGPFAFDEAVGDQPHDDSGDVAVGHHDRMRQLTHRESRRRSLEGREHVEPRQGGGKVGGQAVADALLDHQGAAQQTQPQTQ